MQLTRDIHLRLDRAQEHLNLIDSEVRRYTDSRPYTPVIQGHGYLDEVLRQWDGMGEETRADVLTRGLQIVAIEARPPPARIAVVASDMIHNLRSCLDHIAWQLVLAYSNDRPVHGGSRGRINRRPEPLTGFAIKTEQVALDSNGLPSEPLLWPRTSDEVEAILHGLQPYQRPNPETHPHAILQRLSNADKHRALHVTSGVIGAFETRCIMPDGTSIGFDRPMRAYRIRGDGVAGEIPLIGAHEGDAIIGTLPLDQAIPSLVQHPGQVQVDAKVTLVVSLDEPGTSDAPARPIVETLQELHDFISEKVLPPLIALP